jgi:thiol-disulfide isomerase/thioredoxin
LEDTRGGSQTTRGSWARTAAYVLAGLGVIAFVYVLLAGTSKPVTGYARFATGAMTKLVVLPDPPPMPASSPLKDASGAETNLAAYRGKVVLVNLWASWCTPCIAEMPTLGALQQRFAGQDFAVLPITIDDDAALPKAKTMLADLAGGHLPFLSDSTRRVAFAVNPPGVPTSILYDRAGNEIARLPGEADWNAPEAVALIEAALANE